MASMFGNFAHSIYDWASAADRRYREARKVMDLDDHVLRDVGITREDLMDELGIRRQRKPGTRVAATDYGHGLAN